MTPLKLFVGVHGGGFNGIDTYTEQVAVAAAEVGHEVVLLGTDERVAERLRGRAVAGVQIDHLGLRPLTSARALLERLSPTAAAHRALRAVAAFIQRRPEPQSVWHLSRAPLAAPLHGRVRRVCTAAWFYPHAPLARVRETWHHIGGQPLRRVAITLKSLDFYRWDQIGFRASDAIAAPTELLAAQLRAQGLPAFTCPPPARSAAPVALARRLDPQRRRFLVVSGDLGHPRKNLKDAVAAVAQFGREGGQATLAAAGRNPERIARLAEAQGVSFEFLGGLEPRALAEEMQRADALVFPSRYEEWGYVAVEALLSGTPVVTYPVYPFAEMLSDGLGVVAEGQDVSHLAAALHRAVSLPHGQLLAAAAAKRYGSKAVGEQLTRLWQGEVAR